MQKIKTTCIDDILFLQLFVCNIPGSMASSELSQYLPGTAGLVDQLDKRLLLIMHDGRHLIGTLRTFDQYLNLVLEETIERVIYEGNEDDFYMCCLQ